MVNLLVPEKSDAIVDISIILPTYNREMFLPEALAAIRNQRWTDWELIVVDDGSTDKTRELVAELTRDWEQPVRYVYQENQGAYGARNTGLDLATGKYVAFYDSDDLWLPHHLKDCADALDANADVDWVYGSCRMVNMIDGTEIVPTTFVSNGQLRPFRLLKVRRAGNLNIINDTGAASCQVLHGLYCGLQTSVIRRSLFKEISIPAFAVGEDQLLTIIALLRGHSLGYLDQVHVVYRVHEDNLSSSGERNLTKAEKNRLSLTNGFEWLLSLKEVTPRVRTAIHWRLGQEYFWNLGYSVFWQGGNRAEALAMFRKGIASWPWDWRFYKTYGLAMLRAAYARH